MKAIVFFALATLCFAQLELDEAFIKFYNLEVVTKSESTEQPKKGDFVTVHYHGTLTTGKTFDSSKDRDHPIDFILGHGSVIKCWDEVVARLHVGDEVKVLCPAHKAYGAADFGGTIPAHSDMYYELQLISFKRKEQDL